MQLILIVVCFASLIYVVSTKHTKKTDTARSETTNLHRLQDAVALLNSSISGYSTKYPSGQRFLDFAATVNAIQTFENTSEINREIPKLRVYMEKLDELVNSNIQLPDLILPDLYDRYNYEKHWWKKGIPATVQKILSSYEFKNISKTSAAQKLKNHLDETFGRSHWPEEDVHRFGILIFNDSFFHPTVNSDDQNAFLLPWKKQKSIILVYKSTFGSDGNGTYLSNQKFFEENIATINNTLGSVLRGGCYFGPHFFAIVPYNLKWVTTNLKKSHEGLFYFWLTTDEKVTVPRDSWLKFLFKTKEVDREWTAADIGWAVGTSEESRAAAVIKTVIPGITCVSMEKGVFPLFIMVGF
ncbi:hypothetical protein QR680_004240 [Steinernema hermaphroditum]|uniref:Uncharacterized protein n=1 Tax=Steinernema hermaphroditum TaxID=289476 RepID=A0AA39HN25_9BILA|nr:hypothetical protein QR680_004240 [Steinernema hermaphroditum]